jgi:hypothetical protein
MRTHLCTVATAALLVVATQGAHGQCCGDCDGNGAVAINELITAVNNALNGCTPSPPTPSATIPTTNIPTPTVTLTSAPANTPTMTPTQLGDHFVDNGDGTITDTQTRLIWDKKDNLDGLANFSDPHDADNTYTWSTSGTVADGTAYTDFLAKLNNGASTDGGASTAITGCFAGHCDWRLPTIVELQGIVDATQGNCGGGSGACIDPAFGPTHPDDYWSATTDAGSPARAWFVDFSSGVVDNFRKSSTYYVRAVRGGL